jgi:hypothetical protein
MSFVSRSVYQRKCEECKRMIEDIRILVIGPDVKKWAAVTNKWRDEFERQKKIEDIASELFSHYKKSKIKKSK